MTMPAELVASVTQPVFDWSFFTNAVIHPSGQFMTGLWRTIYISVVAQALGVVFGFVIALMRRSRFAGFRAAGAGYVWLVRGTPLLVQLVVVYNGLAATGLYRFEDSRVGPWIIMGVIKAAILTLAANEAAYMSEIFRAALDSIDVGQSEAAKALGMTPALSMRVVLLPQAFRITIPPLGNEFNLMMKSTSLLSVIGVQEMFLTAQSINSATFKTFEIFLAAAVYYLLLTGAWTIIQRWIEHRFNKGIRPATSSDSLRSRFMGSVRDNRLVGGAR
ncbi:amino acid ABC transporter permease [Angustibacter sp. Root456]|uniref:amino acid ABC transporter permease n=1 Tax=Angustibacter sp. Root456 TaxID=1736539 RepID=UPI000AF509C3|nr:amino acid ABC transporter permease [Angustibacter sp. Root456]